MGKNTKRRSALHAVASGAPSPGPDDAVLAAAASHQAYLRDRSRIEHTLSETPPSEMPHVAALFPSVGALLVHLEKAFLGRYRHGADAGLPKALAMLAAALRESIAVGVPPDIKPERLVTAIRKATREIRRAAGSSAGADPFTDAAPAWRKDDPSPKAGDPPHAKDGAPVRELMQRHLDEHAANNPASDFYVEGFAPLGAGNVKLQLERELAAFLRARTTADDKLVVAWLTMKTRDTEDVAALLHVAAPTNEAAWTNAVHKARKQIHDDGRRKAKKRDVPAVEATAIVSAVLSAQGVGSREHPRPRATRRRG